MKKLSVFLIKENEYKDYLISKGQIYKKLGSNKLYFKSLIDLILHNYFEYFNILKEEQQERDFLASLEFIIDNLNINKNSNIELLHSILKDNLCERGIIKFLEYFNLNTIYNDIFYFKKKDITKACYIYEEYIIHLTKSNNLTSLIKHITEYKIEFSPKNFDKFINKLKPLLTEKEYEYIKEI